MISAKSLGEVFFHLRGGGGYRTTTGHTGEGEEGALHQNGAEREGHGAGVCYFYFTMANQEGMNTARPLSPKGKKGAE